MKKRNILAMILAGCLVFSSGTTFASTQKYVLAGENRYETAVKVSEYGFNRASNVVLVNGTSIADALSATPYAKMKDAPILLTEKNSLNFDTRDEIRRLKASNVYIVGGKSVVSDSVVNDLKKIGCNVYRIAGSDRYETSLNVAKEMDKKEDISEVAVVNGITGLADALSVASPAASRHIPIILSSRDNLWGSEKWMNDEKISKSYIIGGKAAISVDVENKLNNSERLFGQNRWETNAEVLEYFFNTNDLYNVYLAKDGSLNKNQLVDALAAGSVAAKENSPVILLGTELHGTQEEYLKSRNSKLLTEVGYGLNRKAVEKVNFTLNFKNVGETEVGFVDYKNCEQIQIHFGSPIDESTVIYNGKLKRDVIDISATDDHTIEGDIDGLDEFYARLESDKKTLTITRDISKGKIFNGTYDIRVSDKVKTKDGLSLEPYVERLRIVDQIAPQVESVIYNDTYGELTINFTEPIKKFPNITIDGKYVTEDQNVSFSNTKDKIVLNRKKLNELESIGRTIQIIVDGSKDYRGLEMVRYAQSIRLVKPSEERKVESVKLRNSKEMEILFASPINPNSVLDSNGKILKNNISITSVGDNKKDSIISSGDDLYGSLSPDRRTLVIRRDFNNDKFFEGRYNVLVTENVMTIDNASIVKYNETVTLTDSKKPEVTSIKYDERTGKITITFSEPIKKKPIITMTGGYIDKGNSATFKETEMTLNTATRDSITISYEAIKEHNLVKYDEPDGKEYEITVENANDFAENVQQKYGPKKIHIKPMDEGFKVDKVEIFDKNNRKNGENVFLVYFNEKINKPTGKNFGLEGIATEASLIEFVENPETKVNDSKVVKVTFGEGTVNVGKTDGTDETEGSGPKSANLTIKDIKAQSGRILRYAEGTVTVRDNTAPKVSSATYDAEAKELKITYNEDMNFKTLENFSSDFQNKYSITSNIDGDKFNSETVSIKSITKIDSRTIIYEFNDSDNKYFRKLMAGDDFKLTHRGNEYDSNGVESNEATKDDIKVIERQKLTIGYIEDISSQYESKFAIWFSEAPLITGSHIEIIQDGNQKILNKFIKVEKDKKFNNKVYVYLERNVIEDNINATLTIKDVINPKKLVGYSSESVNLKENMETKLKEAKYDSSKNQITLTFDKNVDGTTAENLFNSFDFKNEDGITLQSKPRVKTKTSTETTTIDAIFDITGNDICKKFLDFMTKSTMVNIVSKDTTKGIEDYREWSIKANDNIQLKKTNIYPNQLNTGDCEITDATYYFGDNVLQIKTNKKLELKSIEDGLFNSVSFYSNKDNILYDGYPTIGNVKLISRDNEIYTYNVHFTSDGNFKTFLNRNSKVYICSEDIFFKYIKREDCFMYDENGYKLRNTSIVLNKSQEKSDGTTDDTTVK
ncbi:cell wall-binding repeat-containing protein [Clostridium senegalense]|uniref:Cell wall-binding repeat-containing protein n=1 Tax=Clostridium senegalense TaxID=1465809 RepID=A0A6M0H5N8_9CLOT|nr:cell wall-binding repeat-containing protein [Clostridium senegalense]NEU05564.1 cell wall-binding repeat-containing protein [Clostridium senegalense]